MQKPPPNFSPSFTRNSAVWRRGRWFRKRPVNGLDCQMAENYGIEFIAPNRSNRKIATQDGRPLRRYTRRWKIERLFAWLHNIRRLVVRYEYHADNYQGFLHLAAALILMRHV